jgi:signal transduction histidine kinase
VSTLLKLARLEMGAEKFDREAVDVGAIVGELLRSLSASSDERGLRIENQVEVGELVEGDREVLRIVASNLLSNALYYSPARGLVECRTERAADVWRLVVENEAADLRPEDLAAVAEPFWRKDGSRTDRNRSGLGLALSRALAEKAGMELGFELVQGRFRASLSVRVAPGSRAPVAAVGHSAAGSGNGAS